MTQTEELNIPSMTCESCANKIRSALMDSGVQEVSFDFKSRNATIKYDPYKIDVGEIKGLISRAGYEVN